MVAILEPRGGSRSNGPESPRLVSGRFLRLFRPPPLSGMSLLLATAEELGDINDLAALWLWADLPEEVSTSFAGQLGDIRSLR
eukprot:6463486-Amphidinium_carterae.1